MPSCSERAYYTSYSVNQCKDWNSGNLPKDKGWGAGRDRSWCQKQPNNLANISNSSWQSKCGQQNVTPVNTGWRNSVSRWKQQDKAPDGVDAAVHAVMLACSACDKGRTLHCSGIHAIAPHVGWKKQHLTAQTSHLRTILNRDFYPAESLHAHEDMRHAARSKKT